MRTDFTIRFFCRTTLNTLWQQGQDNNRFDHSFHLCCIMLLRLTAVSTCMFAATNPIDRQTEKKTDSKATALRLSEELFSMLTAEGAKPDDVAVIEKIEELEVCVCVCEGYQICKSNREFRIRACPSLAAFTASSRACDIGLHPFLLSFFWKGGGRLVCSLVFPGICC